MMDFLLVTAAVLLIVVVLIALVAIVSSNIIKVPPSMVAIFSGRKRVVTDPVTGERQSVGYRIIKGGSSVRIPIVERVDYLSRALARRLKFDVAEGTEWDRVVCIFSLNTVCPALRRSALPTATKLTIPIDRLHRSCPCHAPRLGYRHSG